MNSYGVAQSDKRVLVQRKTNLNLNTSLAHLVPSHLRDTKAPLCSIDFFSCWLLGCLCGPVIKWAFGRRCQKLVARGGKTRGSGTEKRCSHKWFHMSFSCTDTFCTLSALPLKNPQGVANLKNAICVVRSDSTMGVTL